MNQMTQTRCPDLSKLKCEINVFIKNIILLHGFFFVYIRVRTLFKRVLILHVLTATIIPVSSHLYADVHQLYIWLLMSYSNLNVDIRGFSKS